MPEKRLMFNCAVCRNPYGSFEQATVCEAIHAQLQIAFEAIEQAIEYITWLRPSAKYEDMYVWADLHNDPPRIELRRRLKDRDKSDQAWTYHKGQREILSGSRVPSIQALIEMGWRKSQPICPKDDDGQEKCADESD